MGPFQGQALSIVQTAGIPSAIGAVICYGIGDFLGMADPWLAGLVGAILGAGYALYSAFKKIG